MACAPDGSTDIHASDSAAISKRCGSRHRRMAKRWGTPFLFTHSLQLGRSFDNKMHNASAASCWSAESCDEVAKMMCGIASVTRTSLQASGTACMAIATACMAGWHSFLCRRHFTNIGTPPWRTISIDACGSLLISAKNSKQFNCKVVVDFFQISKMRGTPPTW